MSNFRRFAERLHDIRETVQRQEEVELARVTHEHQVVVERVQAAQRSREAATETRNRQVNGADLAMWHHYVMALEQRESEERERLQTTEQRVGHQQSRVRTAYQDSRRWETMADRLRNQEHAIRAAKFQKDADDMASQRANRGQSE